MVGRLRSLANSAKANQIPTIPSVIFHTMLAEEALEAWADLYLLNGLDGGFIFQRQSFDEPKALHIKLHPPCDDSF